MTRMAEALLVAMSVILLVHLTTRHQQSAAMLRALGTALQASKHASAHTCARAPCTRADIFFVPQSHTSIACARTRARKRTHVCAWEHACARDLQLVELEAGE